MTDGEANHLIPKHPLPFQANVHPGMSPLTLVQPPTALGGSPAENKHSVPAWPVSVRLEGVPAAVPWSGGVGDVQLGHRFGALGGSVRPPLQRAGLQQGDERHRGYTRKDKNRAWASTERTRGFTHVPSPWLDVDRERCPRYCTNCENKKPPSALVCSGWTNTRGTRVASHMCPSRGTRRGSPCQRGTWAGVPGEAIHPGGSDLGARPAQPPQSHGTTPVGASGGWHWGHGSSEMPPPTPCSPTDPHNLQ